jgi:hypothetical protein
MSHHLLSVVYPWWFRLFYRPMGFFFDGSAQSSTMLGWLQGQLRSPHIEIYSNSIKDLAYQSFWKQFCETLLGRSFEGLHSFAVVGETATSGRCSR